MILMVIGLLLILFCIILIVIEDCTNRKTASNKPFIAVISCLIGTITFGNALGSLEYKRGQIDAINGKIQWELKDQKDGTRTWVEKSIKDE